MCDFEILYRYFPEENDNIKDSLPRNIGSIGRDKNSVRRSTAMWTGCIGLRIESSVGCFEYVDELTYSFKCGGFLE